MQNSLWSTQQDRDTRVTQLLGPETGNTNCSINLSNVQESTTCKFQSHPAAKARVMKEFGDVFEGCFEGEYTIVVQPVTHPLAFSVLFCTIPLPSTLLLNR